MPSSHYKIMVIGVGISKWSICRGCIGNENAFDGKVYIYTYVEHFYNINMEKPSTCIMLYEGSKLKEIALHLTVKYVRMMKNIPITLIMAIQMPSASVLL